MKKGITRTVCGILCGLLLSGSGILQGMEQASAKPTRIKAEVTYQWHLEPTIEADNILVGDYYDSWEGLPYFYRYVYIEKNGKYGFIDHEGNIAVEPVYDGCNAPRYGMDEFKAVYDTKSGESIAVSIGDDFQEHIMTNTGMDYGVPPIGGPYIHSYLWSTTDNKAYMVLSSFPQNGDLSSCDMSGYDAFIVQPATFSLKAYNNRRVETGAPLKDYSGVGDSELVSPYFGLAGPEGLLVEPEYKYAYASSAGIRIPFDNNYCAFSKDKEKWTVFDCEGDEVASDLEPFEDNYFYEYAWEPVSVMLYNEDFESYEKDFYVPSPFLPTENVIAAKKDGKCGYIDLRGNVLVDFGEFEDIRPVHNGLAWVKKNGKWGVIELLKKGKGKPVKEDPCDINYIGGTVEDVLCTEEMFEQDNTVYHKDISTLAVALSMAAYDGYDETEEKTGLFSGTGTISSQFKTDKNGIPISSGDHKGYYIMDAYDTLGFDNKMLFSYSECPDEYKTGFTFKMLHIVYTGMNNAYYQHQWDIIYSTSNGYKNERAVKLYKEYLNGNWELTENYEMSLYDDAYFDDYDARAFSIATKEFEDSILVAFAIRGTSGFSDFITDAGFLPDGFDIKDSSGNTVKTLDLHQGFSVFYEDTLLGWKLYQEKYGDYIKSTGKQVKFLFTGHSLGAADANICGYAANLGAFGDDVTEDDIFTYTYATPNVVTNYSEDTLNHARNIFNLLNRDDMVAFIPPGYVKFGNCRQFKVEDEQYEGYYLFDGLKSEVGNLTNDHAFGRYVEGVKRSMFSESGENWVEHYYECPVDVEVYYKDELVGRIKDEVTDEENMLPMFVDDSGGKSFALPEDEDFEVRVTAYDKGSMNVKFQETAINGEPAGEMYEYNDIALEKGKLFSVPVRENAAGQRVYVIDEDGKVLSVIGEDTNSSSDEKKPKIVFVILIADLSLLLVMTVLLVVVLKRRKKRNNYR